MPCYDAGAGIVEVKPTDDEAKMVIGMNKAAATRADANIAALHFDGQDRSGAGV